MKKRADGRYQRRVSLGRDREGKPVYEYIYGKTMKEVNEKYTELMYRKNRGAVLVGGQMTVEQLADEWLTNEKAGNVRPQSFYQLKCDVSKISKSLGHIRVQALTAYDIECFRDRLKDEGTETMFNRCLIVLRSMLNYAIRHDVVARNVTVGIHSLKHEAPKKRVLTPFELAAIQRAELDPDQRAMLEILFYTGIRRGELLALEVKDVDFSRRLLSISKTVLNNGTIQDNTKTKAGTRLIYIPDALLPALQDWCQKVERGLLFPSQRGPPMMVASSAFKWKRISERIFGDSVPEDFTYHLFRHTYASNLYKAGVDLKTAQYLLGHTDIKTTMNIYTHFGSQDIDVNRINDFFKSSQKVVKNA